MWVLNAIKKLIWPFKANLHRGAGVKRRRLHLPAGCTTVWIEKLILWLEPKSTHPISWLKEKKNENKALHRPVLQAQYRQSCFLNSPQRSETLRDLIYFLYVFQCYVMSCWSQTVALRNVKFWTSSWSSAVSQKNFAFDAKLTKLKHMLATLITHQFYDHPHLKSEDVLCR